ncbi:MAG: hypothetical protein IPP74_13595 [Alphaproteobacteria bacterium]|nr:hypothetical protein [Alphaproteobacteria bacterium]
MKLLKAFPHFNKSGGNKCPICLTNDDEKTILVPIDGTEDDGLVECEQIHLNCISLRINKGIGYIYQVVKNEPNN